MEKYTMFIVWRTILENGSSLPKQSVSKFNEKSAKIKNCDTQQADPKFLKMSKEQRIAMIVLKKEEEGKKEENKGERKNLPYQI